MIRYIIIAWLACALFVDNVKAPATGAPAVERIENFFLRLSGPIGLIRTVIVMIRKKVKK